MAQWLGTIVNVHDRVVWRSGWVQNGWDLLSICLEVACSVFERQRSIAIKLHCIT